MEVSINLLKLASLSIHTHLSELNHILCVTFIDFNTLRRVLDFNIYLTLWFRRILVEVLRMCRQSIIQIVSHCYLKVWDCYFVLCLFWGLDLLFTILQNYISNRLWILRRLSTLHSRVTSKPFWDAQKRKMDT